MWPNSKRYVQRNIFAVSVDYEVINIEKSGYVWQTANATELTALRCDLKKLEEQMVAEEIKRANESIRARDLVAPELAALKAQLEQERARTTALTSQMTKLEADVRYSNRALEEAQAQLERERCGHLRHVRSSVRLRLSDIRAKAIQRQRLKKDVLVS